MRIIVLTIVGMVFTFSNVHCGSGSGDSTPQLGNGNGGTVTTLIITNTGSAAVTIGFVTAATGGACPDVSQLLTAEELANEGWCTDFQGGVDNAGKCLVTLDAAGGANDSVTVPNPDGKCISGGFGAGGFAQCETAQFPTGWTQAEFTLNPKVTTEEAVDISAVNGVNYAVSILLGSGWFYGTQTFVTTVGPNKAINGNVGTTGVFPNGCTDCIQLVGAPPCPNLTSNPTCQATRICNVRRENASGGTVEFQIGELL